MRIGYFADGPWSHKALEKIVDDGRFEIAFIVPRYNTQDPVLKRWATKLGVDFLPLENVNHPGSIEKLKEYDAELFVSMSFDQILKRDILIASNKGFINCHAGALPFYRGRNILNWVLINDEPEFGVTVHYIDEGIDTGDIILQKMSKITDGDDYASLLARAINLCAELLHEALVLISNDSVLRTKQKEIHPVGHYCSRRRDGDEWIDWSWPSRRVFNFIRAIGPPGPCARSFIAGKEVKIKKASMINNAPSYIGVPGEIVGVGSSTVIVKTGDSTIKLELIEFLEENNGVDDSLSAELLRIGRRFCNRDVETVVNMMRRIEELESRLDNTKHHV